MVKIYSYIASNLFEVFSYITIQKLFSYNISLNGQINKFFLICLKNLPDLIVLLNIICFIKQIW